MADQKKVRVHDVVNKAIIEFIEKMYLVELIKWSIVQFLLNIPIKFMNN